MAKDSESRAKPVTVSELMARLETSGSAFPKSASEEDQRTLRRAGASGMPSHKPVEPEPEPVVDDDEVGPEANVVTGIIPIVNDEPLDVTDALEPVPADDLVGVDLPAVDDGAVAGVAHVADVDVDDPEFDDAPAFADAVDFADAPDLVEDDEPTDTGRHVATAAELEAARGAEDAVEADEREQKRAAAKKAKKAKEESHSKSALIGWLILVGEAILGLAVGAGLFWGFTELWKRYVYLALILAVVVIFAIVAFAHVLRKRDLPTTLLALGVGMLVTIGPLVLLAA